MSRLLRTLTGIGSLQGELQLLYCILKHPHTPWYAKVAIGSVLGYAVSPFDVIPDFIPFVGQLDDLVIVPSGIALALKLVPEQVLRECKREAGITDEDRRHRRLVWAIALFLIVLILALTSWVWLG